MALYRRTARELCEQAEDARDREFPQCLTCDGRIGLDCQGHEEEGEPEPVKTIGELMAELKARIAGGAS